MNEELLDKVGKKLPYRETDEYVDTLVQRCAENALKAAKRGPGRAKKIWITAAAAAAVAVLAVTVVPKLLSPIDNVGAGFAATLASIECNAASVNASADLSDVLSEMTYDQLTSVSFYLTDDIYVPEY